MVQHHLNKVVGIGSCMFALLFGMYILSLPLVSDDADLVQSADVPKVQVQAQNISNSSDVSESDYNLLSSEIKKIEPQCDYGYLTDYASIFEEPIPIHTKHNVYTVNKAYGCSVYHEYCNGPIQSIPCCRKLIYDMWYAIDEPSPNTM